ncbi:MAG: hypothetical protein CL893_01550 [Dehalococcoidia bacterium]|nr:hypothetical protein [Dehalococcoidia bacterium]|tara:strand:+ start:2152 stop:2622 length:471 start_codon:yes stop_codon:yes gene_type:complete
MKKTILFLLFISSFLGIDTLYAQDNDEIVNGFIKDASIENEYISLHLVDNFGNDFKFEITPDTEIGIETQSGERWVGSILDDKDYVLTLLEEAQHSLEPMTAKYSGNKISSLVSYESSNIKNNLGYLAGSFIFLAILFFGYIFIINNKLKILSAKK